MVDDFSGASLVQTADSLIVSSSSCGYESQLL